MTGKIGSLAHQTGELSRTFLIQMVQVVEIVELKLGTVMQIADRIP